MNELPWIDECFLPSENNWCDEREIEDLFFIKEIYSIAYARIKLYIDSGSFFCLKDIYKDFIDFHYNIGFSVDSRYNSIIEESIKNLIVNTIRYLVKHKDTMNYKYKDYEFNYKNKYNHQLFLPDSLNQLIIFNFTNEYHHEFILNEIFNLLKTEDLNFNFINFRGSSGTSEVNYFRHLFKSIKDPILLNSIKNIIENISNFVYEKNKSIDNVLSNSKYFIDLPDCFYLPYCDDLIDELINTESKERSLYITLMLNSKNFNPNNYFDKLKNTPFKYSFYHHEAILFINEFYLEIESLIKDYIYHNANNISISEPFNKFKLNHFDLNSNYEILFRKKMLFFIKDIHDSNDRIKDLLE